MDNIKNLTIFYNHRAYDTITQNNIIQSINAMELRVIKNCVSKLKFLLILLVTAWLGAEYRYGRESNKKFNEETPNSIKLHNKHDKSQVNIKFVWCPDKTDNRVMGSRPIVEFRERYQRIKISRSAVGYECRKRLQ